MNAWKLASIYRSGPMEFRPRSVSREFVLKKALADPVKAVQISAELASQSPTLAMNFAIDLEAYSKHRIKWLWCEKWNKEPGAPLWKIADAELA